MPSRPPRGPPRGPPKLHAPRPCFYSRPVAQQYERGQRPAPPDSDSDDTTLPDEETAWWGDDLGERGGDERLRRPTPSERFVHGATVAAFLEAKKAEGGIESGNRQADAGMKMSCAKSEGEGRYPRHSPTRTLSKK
ncbi:hypothetical protein E4U54_000661 [Claviceps lovelessii]|nr:hypothetical protein E4U54_000661 [Claviceps lovelessii]